MEEDKLKYRIPLIINGICVRYDYYKEGDEIKHIYHGRYGSKEYCSGKKDLNDKLIYQNDVVLFYKTFGNSFYLKMYGKVCCNEGIFSIEDAFGEKHDLNREIIILGNIYDRKRYLDMVCISEKFKIKEK